jgi:hypothetical protein
MRTSNCTLADCVVDPDGQGVRLNVTDAEGKPTTLLLSLDQLGSLAMTLPSLMERALKQRHRDDSLRYVYPLGSWTVELSATGEVRILSLATPDGFKASFGVPRDIAEDLAEALGNWDEASTAARGRVN